MMSPYGGSAGPMMPPHGGSAGPMGGSSGPMMPPYGGSAGPVAHSRRAPPEKLPREVRALADRLARFYKTHAPGGARCACTSRVHGCPLQSAARWTPDVEMAAQCTKTWSTSPASTTGTWII